MKSPVFVLAVALAATVMSCGNKAENTPSNTASNRPATTSSPAANTSGASSSSATGANAPITVTGKWEMVGKEGDWKATVDMVGMDGFLWSVEADGSLYKTDPATGNFTQARRRLLFAINPHSSLQMQRRSA